MSQRFARKGVCLLLAALALASWPSARAQAQNPDCASLPGTVIYGAGGSAQTPLVGRVARVFANATAPVSVVYQDAGGACVGIYALTGTGAAAISGTGYYWNTAGTRANCNLPAGGATVQFASMGNGPGFCPLVAGALDYPQNLAHVIDKTGPIATVNLFVPPASSVTVLSAEAIYLLYGLGPAANIAPFTVADSLIHRNESSYVQQYLANAIGLPAGKFKYGRDAGNNATSVLWVAESSATPALVNTGLGFASGEVADANRATVRTIAYQHIGQAYGYTPDSDSTTKFDKANVRDGSYFLWGAGHFYALDNGTTGQYANAAVQQFIEFIHDTGAAPAGTTANITDLAIANNNVPQCAMQVGRDTDLGPLYSFQHPQYCGAYFDAKISGGGLTTPVACPGGQSECTNPGSVCRRGYCEAY